MRGVYIHIPFCAHKCGYCDFVSFVPKSNDIEKYLAGLEKEFSMYDEEYSMKNDDIKTIFIGGGTPSILSVEQLDKLFKIINKHIDVSGVEEYTVECNPGTLTMEKLAIMKENGVNRLSIGLQAIQSKHLEFMERIHDLRDFEESIKYAKKIGFTNINVDLIYAFEGQSLEEWNDTLEYVINTGISHISCYSLIIEEGTAFYKKYESGELSDVSEELFIKMYRHTVKKLSEKGFQQYEISNYSKENFECKHNIGYWTCSEYYGIGLGASGYINNERYTNEKLMDEYIQKVEYGVKPLKFKEKLDKIDIYNEKIMLGLRMNLGISSLIIDEIDNPNQQMEIKKILEKYIEEGYLKLSDNNMYRLTQSGREISNSIIMDLMI